MALAGRARNAAASSPSVNCSSLIHMFRFSASKPQACARQKASKGPRPLDGGLCYWWIMGLRPCGNQSLYFAFFHHFGYLGHVLVASARQVDQQYGAVGHGRGHLHCMGQGVRRF